jgi:hypothetical protein
MTENTPSSSNVGARPNVDAMRSYSSAVSPCCNAVATVTDIYGPDTTFEALTGVVVSA